MYGGAGAAATPQIAFLQLFNSKPHVGTADMGLGMRQLFIYTPW